MSPTNTTTASNLELGVVFTGSVSAALDGAVKSLIENLNKIEQRTAGVTNAVNSMSTQSSQGILRLTSNLAQVTPTISNLTGQISNAANQWGKLGGIGAGTVNRMSKYTKDITDRVGDFIVSTGRFFITWRAFWAVYSSIGKSFELTKQFQQEMGIVAGVVMATTEELNSLKEAAYRASKETGTSLTEIAKGMRILAQAGLSVQEVKLVITDIAKLARATGSSFEATSNLVTTAMRVWNIGAEQVTRISNVMAGAANYSKTSIEGLNTTFAYLAPTAALAGYSLEQTAAAIAVMSNAGLRASTIGTGMSTLLGSLLARTGKFEKSIKSLGLSFKDFETQSGQLKPFAEILDLLIKRGYDIRDAFEGLEKRAARELATALTQGAEAFKLMELRLTATNVLSIQFARALDQPMVKLQILGNQILVGLVKRMDAASNGLYKFVMALYKFREPILILTSTLLPMLIQLLLKFSNTILTLGIASVAKYTAAFNALILKMLMLPAGFNLGTNVIVAGLTKISTAVLFLSRVLSALTLPLFIGSLVWSLVSFIKAAKDTSQSTIEMNAAFAEQEGTILRVIDNFETLNNTADKMSFNDLNKVIGETNILLAKLGLTARLTAINDVGKLREEISGITDDVRQMYYEKSWIKALTYDSGEATKLQEQLNAQKKVTQARRDDLKYQEMMGRTDPKVYRIEEMRKDLAASLAAEENLKDKINVTNAERENGLRTALSISKFMKKSQEDVYDDAIYYLKYTGQLTEENKQKTWDMVSAMFQQLEAQKKQVEEKKEQSKFSLMDQEKFDKEKEIAEIEAKLQEYQIKGISNLQEQEGLLKKLYKAKKDQIFLEAEQKKDDKNEQKEDEINADRELKYAKMDLELKLKLLELQKNTNDYENDRLALLAQITELDSQIALQTQKEGDAKTKLLNEQKILQADIIRQQEIISKIGGKTDKASLQDAQRARQQIFDNLNKIEKINDAMRDMENTENNIYLLRAAIKDSTNRELSGLQKILQNRKDLTTEMEKQIKTINDLGGMEVDVKRMPPKKAQDYEKALRQYNETQGKVNQSYADEADWLATNNQLLDEAKRKQVEQEMKLSSIMLEKEKYSKTEIYNAKMAALGAKANAKMVELATYEYIVKTQNLPVETLDKYKEKILDTQKVLAEMGQEAGQLNQFWDTVYKSMGDGVMTLTDKLAGFISKTEDMNEAVKDWGRSFVNEILKVSFRLIALTTLWKTVGSMPGGQTLLNRMGLQNPLEKGGVPIDIKGILGNTTKMIQELEKIYGAVRERGGEGLTKAAGSGVTTGATTVDQAASAAAAAGDVVESVTKESTALTKTLGLLPSALKLLKDMFGGLVKSIFGIFVADGGRIPSMAQGGRSFMSFPGRKDSQLTFTKPGEYIVPESGANMLGDKMLAKIRDGNFQGITGSNFKNMEPLSFAQPSSTTHQFIINAVDAPSFSKMLATREAQEMISAAIVQKFTHNNGIRRTLNKGY